MPLMVEVFVQQRDGGQDGVAMQAVGVQPVGHVVAGHHENQLVGKERVQQALENHRVGNVRDMEFVEADDGITFGSAACHFVERVGHGLERFQLLVHGPHEFMKMQAGLAFRGQCLEKAVHQEALATPHPTVHPDATGWRLSA